MRSFFSLCLAALAAAPIATFAVAIVLPAAGETHEFSVQAVTLAIETEVLRSLLAMAVLLIVVALALVAVLRSVAPRTALRWLGRLFAEAHVPDPRTDAWRLRSG